MKKVAIDLDGTFAEYKSFTNDSHIGKMNQEVKEFVLNLINHGYEPVIFTAREAGTHGAIRQWMKSNGLEHDFEITNIKQKDFIAIIDDRAITFIRNKYILDESLIAFDEVYGYNLASLYDALSERMAKDNNDKYNPLDVQIGGDHYRTMKIQRLEYCYINQIPFIESGVIKYVSRHESKGDSKDIKKAIHLLQLLLKLKYDE